MRPSSALWSITLNAFLASAFLLPSSLNNALPGPGCHHRHHTPANPSWLGRVRNRVIEVIWTVPKSTDQGEAKTTSRHRNTPPQDLVARYGDDVVLRFKIKNGEELHALAEATRVLFLDVWESTGEWADIRLSRKVIPSLLGLLPASMQHAHAPLMPDLTQAIYESYPSPASKSEAPQSLQPRARPFDPAGRRPPGETNIFFKDYQPLSVITPWMRLLRSLFPSHTRLISVGTSYEGRNISALRVGVHPTNDEQPSAPRKTILVVGGSHAREWISTSTVNYIAYSFITSYGKLRDITKLLEKFDFVFVPTINPDGYVYTWENDRLWRKNRQPTDLQFCKGLDLDRSYEFQWDGAPPRDNPCSEAFPGNSPFEAVEARQLADWAKNEIENNNVRIVGFLDLHSYSQQVLYPYAFSCSPAPPSLETLQELAIGLAKAIHTTNGEPYGVNSACEGTIPSTCHESCQNTHTATTRLESGGGSALDWFYHELKVPYSYQLKLRDTGTYGFLLPSGNILPTGAEALRLVEYFGNFLAGNQGIEKPQDAGGIHDAVEMKPLDTFDDQLELRRK